MDIQWIKELIRLVEDSSIQELEITEGKKRIRIAKAGLSVVPAPPTDNNEEITVSQQPNELMEIKSPMVGTFHLTPVDGTAPYVAVNSEIVTGDTICHIEAMKLINPIKAEGNYRIKEILVENAHPVEFGQPLFLIEEM